MIKLKKGKERSVLNFHPWVFSGAIENEVNGIEDGTMVSVSSNDGTFLAKGFFNNGSITVRLLTFKDEPIDDAFWLKKIQQAYEMRKSIGLVKNSNTSCYRLLHGEGDNIPGLIVDIYGSTAVMQFHHHGVYNLRHSIAKALQEVFNGQLKCIYNKSADTMPGNEEYKNEYLLGETQQEVILENGHKFNIDWATGQKTGFFIDQRDNRQLLTQYVKGKKVLNTFCYSGGFSVYALEAGASLVHSVDSSKKAIEMTDLNVALTGKQQVHQSFAMDTFSFFKETKEKYDVIVLDPPAFAKHLKALNNAAQGYQRLNRTAFEQIASGGILFTFSCSQVLDKSLFRKIVFSAAAQSGRPVRILHQLTQPADHPISIYHQEGEYLKGLALYVE